MDATDDVANRAEGRDIAGTIRAVAMFASLTDGELAALTESSVIRTFRRNEIVFYENDPAHCCFVVLSGEVDIMAGGNGAARQVRRLGSGEIFGELGVLLGRGRTATVRASRPSELIELPADSFRSVVATNPLALEQWTRLLANRLVATTRGDRTSDTPRVIWVKRDPEMRGASLVAASIAALLHDVTDRMTLWLELVDPPIGDDGDAVAVTTLSRDVSSVPMGPTGWASGTRRLKAHLADATAAQLADAIDRLRDKFAFVVVDPSFDPTTNALAELHEVADATVAVVHRPSLHKPDAERRTLEVVNLHDPRSRPLPINRNDPFVLRVDPELDGLDPAQGAERMLADRWLPSSRTLRRLVRSLLGTTVGVALGGGAAFGLAHVGVLEVLDANQIPVDLIVGTSMGSIVATGYAAGLSTYEMHREAVRIGRSVRTLANLLDLNPMRPGVLSGRKLQQTFNPLLGTVETFDDLVVPCQTVAADIETGERVCMGTGRLEDAFRASSSIPILIAPWLHQGHVLVDGAMVDPVPAEVTREMGADLCIAVNVVPHLRKGVTNVVSRTVGRVSAVNPLTMATRSRGLPGFVDTAMNSIQSLQHELGHFKAASADVRITAELADVSWIEFYKAPAIIERGQEAAEAALPAVRRVLAERLAAALPD